MLRIFLVFFLGLLQATVPGCSQSLPSFVTVENGQFRLQGKPHYFMGANYWYGGLLGLSEAGKQRMLGELDFLKSQGITNLRVMAGAEGMGMINGKIRVEPAYQPQKGRFNDALLTGLDYLLAEMGKRDMKAVIFLSNNWEWSGGFLQYLNWAGLLPDTILIRKLSWDENRDLVSRFYSCNECIQMYYQQLEQIVGRTNTITGLPYKNDPAIFSWQLANEPRPMRPAAIPAYLHWAKLTAQKIRALDPNHLVSAGCEGEMGTETIEVFDNLHRIKEIDYATIHIWPKNWGWFSDTAIAGSLDNIVTRSNDYINRHAAVCARLGKPLVIEEFGLPRDLHAYKLSSGVSLRNTYYRSVLQLCANSAKNKGIIGGFNFWAYGGSGKPSGKSDYYSKGDDLLGDPPQEEQGLNSVFNSDTATWKLIKELNYATHK